MCFTFARSLNPETRGYSKLLWNRRLTNAGGLFVHPVVTILKRLVAQWMAASLNARVVGGLFSCAALFLHFNWLIEIRGVMTSTQIFGVFYSFFQLYAVHGKFLRLLYRYIRTLKFQPVSRKAKLAQRRRTEPLTTLTWSEPIIHSASARLTSVALRMYKTSSTSEAL